jgi:glycerophosphoryl diester phosphodiesterase
MKISSIILCIFFFLASCNSSKKMSGQNNNTPTTAASGPAIFDKQGHRGCRGLMPENTIPAMIRAIGMGITTLEMDVVITKDKQVILSHEPFFNHEITTKPDGTFIEEKDERSFNIYQMDYEQVKTFDVGMKNHPRFPRQEKMKAVKPLLAAAFDSIKNYMMLARRPFPFYNIETKCMPATDGLYHPGPAEFVELLIQVIKDKQLEEQVIIQSFDTRTLKYLHEHYPAIQTALLIEEGEAGLIPEKIKSMEFMPSILSPHYSLVTKKMLEDWHSHKRKVIPWTVNDKATIEALKNTGVDGIISDYPDLFN